MTLRLLIDMNLSPLWVGVLCGAGFEASHWYHIGAANAPDSEIFSWARTNNYIVFTHAVSTSVFQIRTEDVSPSALAPRAIELLNRFIPELTSGALIVVDEMRERIRILPLENN